LILVNSTLLQAQTESDEDTLEETKANARPASACARPEDSASGDTVTPEPDPWPKIATHFKEALVRLLSIVVNKS